MKVIDLLRHSAQKKPDTVAITDGRTDLNYCRLSADVRRLADVLRSHGCKEGVKIAVVLGNCAEYFVSFFAVSLAGGTIVPLTSRMTVYEITKFVKRADVSTILTNRFYSERLLKCINSQAKISIIGISYENEQLNIELLRLESSRSDTQNRDVALMVFTSGTSGLPKIVMLTDDQLISNMFIYKSLMDFREHNIVYCSLSLHHIYCICAQILTHISLADTFIIEDKPFFIKDFLGAVEKNKVSISAFVPFMAMLMAEFPKPECFNLESLRYITLSGAKTPKKTYEMLVEKYRHIRFINTYGMSEAGSRISIAAPEPAEFPAESVGKSMPGIKVRIVNENGRILSANMVGEVEVKGSGVMKGYYRNDSLTAETIVDGWLKTGDLGRLDNENNLFLVGRKKEIIISGGDKIYPSEIEECLLEHPSVLESAVISRPDKRLQEVPCAFVVVKSKHEVKAIELLNFCKRRLSSYKLPRQIYFVKELPKLGTSKIDRHKLKGIIQRQLQVQL